MQTLGMANEGEVRKRTIKVSDRHRGELNRLLGYIGCTDADLEAPDPEHRATLATHLEMEEKLELDYIAKMSGLRGASGLVRLLARGFLDAYERPTVAKSRKKQRKR